MKKALQIVVALMLVMLSGCGDKKPKEKPTFMFWNYRPEIVSTTYYIPGMKTQADAEKIHQGLNVLTGFQGVEYNPNKQTLKVFYRSSELRSMNVEAAIASRGYEVNGRPAKSTEKQVAP